MHWLNRVLGLIAIIGLCAFIPLVAQAAEIPAPKSKVYKMTELTKETFNALPGTAILEFEGKRFTKQQHLADMEKNVAAIRGRREAGAAASKIALEKRNAELRAQHIQEVNASNVKIETQVVQLRKADAERRAKFQAIQKEAQELNVKVKTAQTPESKANISKRSSELLGQLKQMGY